MDYAITAHTREFCVAQSAEVLPTVRILNSELECCCPPSWLRNVPDGNKVKLETEYNLLYYAPSRKSDAKSFTLTSVRTRNNGHRIPERNT